MTGMQDVKNVLDGIKADIDPIKAGIDSLNAKIADLNAQVAAGTVDPALMADTLAEAQDIKTKMDTMAAGFAPPSAAAPADATAAPASGASSAS